MKEKKLATAGGGVMRQKLRQMKSDRELYLIMIPFLLFYALFVFRPMGGLVIAFKDYSVYKGIADSPCVCVIIRQGTENLCKIRV